MAGLTISRNTRSLMKSMQFSEDKISEKTVIFAGMWVIQLLRCRKGVAFFSLTNENTKKMTTIKARTGKCILDKPVFKCEIDKRIMITVKQACESWASITIDAPRSVSIVRADFKKGV